MKCSFRGSNFFLTLFFWIIFFQVDCFARNVETLNEDKIQEALKQISRAENQTLIAQNSQDPQLETNEESTEASENVIDPNDVPPESRETADGIKDAHADQDIPARTVRFELAKVQGSTGYDIELASIDRLWKGHHSFKIKGDILRVRLNPGRYRVRTRSYNVQNIFGAWSAWKDFGISYKPSDNIYPNEGAVIKPISKVDEKIVFEWPEIKGTYAYLFELKTHDDKLIERKVLKNYFRTATLPVHNKYKWYVVPLAFEGEEKTVNQFPKYNNFEILEPVTNTTPIAIEVKPKKQAYKYEFEFVRFTSYTETTPPTIYESVLPEFRASLQPGEYELRVRAIYRDESKSDWGPASRFYVSFTSAAAKKPEPFEKFDPNHPTKSEVEISWYEVENANRYVVYVYDEAGKILEKVDTEKTSAIVKLPAGAKYYYHVQAYSFREKERPPPPVGERTVAFEVQEYVYQKFSPAEEPTDLYGWANWVGSIVNYKSKNFDNNSSTTNNIFGGTGEVALGYWERKTKLGLLLFGEMSGFTIGSKTYQYKTYGLQIGKRFILEDGARARAWIGIASKDLPELVTHPFTDYLDVQQVQAKGIFLQGNYLKPLSEKYSFYLSASYFQDIGKNKTPNNLGLNYLKGGSFGAFISRSFGTKYKGRLGYSYKFDSSNYSSTTTGAKNQVDIAGHYISFLFEFALREPDDF